MSSSEREAVMRELRMDGDNLYLEETFTDLTVGSIRRLTPVKVTGEPDRERPVLYSGHAQVLSALGPLPLQFSLDAASLEEAVQMFPAAAEEAVKRMVEEIKELQRQQASQIVVPGSPGAGGLGGPGGPMPGPGGGLPLR